MKSFLTSLSSLAQMRERERVREREREGKAKPASERLLEKADLEYIKAVIKKRPTYLKDRFANEQ